MQLSRLIKASALFSLALLGCLQQVHAQEFPPKKTITIVVGFAPGGSADSAARVIAKNFKSSSVKSDCL